MKIHDNENNSESQEHLEENRERFSLQCLKVLELLRTGKRLTTINAPTYGILSLPRRIKDLKDKNGIIIDWIWLHDDKGRKTIKEWYWKPKTDAEAIHHFANSLIEIATKDQYVNGKLF